MQRLQRRVLLPHRHKLLCALQRILRLRKPYGHPEQPSAPTRARVQRWRAALLGSSRFRFSAAGNQLLQQACHVQFRRSASLKASKIHGSWLPQVGSPTSPELYSTACEGRQPSLRAECRRISSAANISQIPVCCKPGRRLTTRGSAEAAATAAIHGSVLLQHPPTWSSSSQTFLHGCFRAAHWPPTCARQISAIPGRPAQSAHQRIADLNTGSSFSNTCGAICQIQFNQCMLVGTE